ncbi:MAG: DsbA family protein [Gaiellaceae bacterium]
MSRNRRLLILAVVAVVAVIGAVAAAVLGHSSGKSAVTTTSPPTSVTTGSETTPTTTSTGAVNSPAAIKALFAGIPQHGDTLGRPSAPVTLAVFEDPQCPYCDQWNLATMPTVISQFVRTGKIKLVYRGLLVVGQNSVLGLRAIVAAGRQNKLWEMNEALYANQGKEESGWITSQLILSLAADMGINGKKLATDTNSKAVTAALEASAAEAKGYGIRGTPSFEILHPPAVPTQLNESSLEPAGFIAALTAAIG